MKVCAQCQKEIPSDLFIGRQAQCPFCRADLHGCLNCSFYDQGVYNDCREPQAERVLEKNRGNFCDYFRFNDSAQKTGAAAASPKDKLAALFKK